MNTSEYLDRLLLHYSGTFNIYQPYVINGKEYPYYGLFYNCTEKYVLVREVNMWSSKSFEHILFMEAEELTDEIYQEADEIIRTYMEPVLVRKNEKLPEENHMYSYLNVVIVCKKPISKELAKKLKKYHFEKGYNFNMRGYSQGSIMCVSLDDEKYISNYYGRTKKKMFLQVFNDVKENKPGFTQVIREKGIEPFKQEFPS